MHKSKWIYYYVLGAGANMPFFDIGSIPALQKTMYVYVGTLSFTLVMLIDKEIVNIILGDMVINSENFYGITRACLLVIYFFESQFFREYRRCHKRQLV